MEDLMMDMETLMRELGVERRDRKADLKRELVKQIIDYFGEEARLVLGIALYFKYPEVYQNVGVEVLNYLREFNKGVDEKGEVA